MSEPFLAEIHIFPFNFAPFHWAFCNGQIMSIQQNTALFSLLGTTYGGNGQTNFALPNLQGRAAMHSGQGPGLSDRFLGEQAGAETHTLTTAEMPVHDHGGGAGAGSLQCSTGPGTSNAANARFPGVTTRPLYADTPTGAGGSLAISTGGNQPHENRQPFLTMSFCIALQGVFPSRN